MQLFGFAYLGPFGHFLHLLLDKLFKGKKDSTTVAKKVISYLLALITFSCVTLCFPLFVSSSKLGVGEGKIDEGITR